ncbi:RuvC-like resolvase [Mycobacterium phage Indlovu]|nr:RuvC-like resolvase [Mycobacterium phage Indlovu]
MSGKITRMRILGIDSSLTATGLARIDIDGWDGDRWKASIATATVSAPKPTKDKSKRAMVRRVNYLVDQIEGAFEDVDAVGIENLAFAAKGENAWVLPWIFGRVLELCEKYGLPVTVVGTSQRAKFAVGKGSGPGTDKDHILAAAIKLFPQADISSNNEADALIVGAATAARLEKPILPTTQYRIEVIEKLSD